MTARVAARLDSLDPGFVRIRAGGRTACATVLSGLTLAVVGSAVGVVDPVRVSLFGAGACFFGALLVGDVRRSDRARTFVGAAIVSAVAIVVTVALLGTAVWAAAAFLVTQMCLSYALRSWSPRAGNLAVIGALITFLTGSMRIADDGIWWFVLAATVGYAWAGVSEYLILPDDPIRSLQRSLDSFSRCVGDAVASVVAVLTASDGGSSAGVHSAGRRVSVRVMRSRRALDGQLSGVGPSNLTQSQVEQLRVALYCAQRGTEVLIQQADDPR